MRVFFYLYNGDIEYSFVVEESTVDGQNLLAAIAIAGSLGAQVARKSNKSGTPENPDKYSVRSNPASIPMLHGALERKLQEIAPGSNSDDLEGFKHLNPGEPHHPGALWTQRFTDGRKNYLLKFDNNQDRAILAHELGHYLNNKGALMGKVADARHTLESNTALSNALANGMQIGNVNIPGMKMTAADLFKTSRYLAPALVAGLIPGDNDVAASVAVNLALSSPKLLDEFMATKRGFGLMKDANMDIPLKSRARMAGAFTSYLATPLLGALGGNLAGNLVDQDA